MNKPVSKREGFVEDKPIEPPIEAAPIETVAEELEETWPIKVRLLHKAVRNNKNEDVRELLFREPTGGDINRYGNPCRVDQNLDIIIDDRKMMLMMAVLAGINLPNLERMDPRDWCSCAYRLRGFFTPQPEAWS